MLTTQTENPAANATQPVAPRFNLADADRAHDEWGANCGPGALAAIMGMTLDEVRPHLVGFDDKHYTNPTMMFGALKSICPGRYATKKLRTAGRAPWDWPRYGLCRVQWEGPWTQPGVPMRARYRYTHWIGSCAANNENIGVFDINCMNNGSGWCSLKNWSDVIAPHLIAQYPRASGIWHLTHAIEIEQPTTGRP
ncbi:hypothetical protein [Ferrovibrio xuzhouensis]|uniref:Peptidase C39-like domain-containing protein n=1 Tax=Ferrovibrio xuzhouensis TaxID=1576914 RepID=A0ABV7VDX3_9PROT